MMPNKQKKIYLDSCCFIDIVANDANITTKENREYQVLCYKDLIKESKNNNLSAYTSLLTIVECTCVKDEKKKSIINNEIQIGRAHV